jgi:hypothetical protein
MGWRSICGIWRAAGAAGAASNFYVPYSPDFPTMNSFALHPSVPYSPFTQKKKKKLLFKIRDEVAIQSLEPAFGLILFWLTILAYLSFLCADARGLSYVCFSLITNEQQAPQCLVAHPGMLEYESNHPRLPALAQDSNTFTFAE